MWKEIDCDIFSQEDRITEEIQQLMEEDEADASGQSPVLCLRDRASHACFWYLVPAKGTGLDILELLFVLMVNHLFFES